MSRVGAFIGSLTIHAFAFVLAGVWFSQNPRHASPGESGAGVTPAGGGTGTLFVEIVASAEPEVSSETSEEQEVAVSEPVPEPVTPVVQPALDVSRPSILPTPSPEVVAEQAEAAQKPASRGIKTARTARAGHGSRAGNETTGVAGAGSGSGIPGYEPPHFLLRYKPPYPDEARARRLEGTVLLLVSLDSSGHVLNATIKQTSGHNILDRTALNAVHSWRFDPARQNGQAVAAQVEVPLRFRFG